MEITISRCRDSVTWKRVGRDANADKPEYWEENVFWPVNEEPLNGGGDLSIVASVGGALVGRLQRRKEHVLEVSVARSRRRGGVGRALVEFAAKDACGSGLQSLRAEEIDETDADTLGFFDALGLARHPQFSMLADLNEPMPARTTAMADDLLRRGFHVRVLDNGRAENVQLAIDLQTRCFRGFPGFISEEQMVRILMANGQMVMLMEKDGAPAAFIIGGVNTTMSNRRFVRRNGWGLLAGIATVEEYRRMGLASAIMVQFVRHLQCEGVRYMLYGGCGPEGTASRQVARSVGATTEVRHFCMVKGF